MAGLVLGVAGAAVGSFMGPLGASIGWSIGSMIGNYLDPPKVQGPRLTDLKLQGSTYGQMIPLIVGTVRVAGNVIDQTDLVEHETTTGGKGGPDPEVTEYSYTVSAAILIGEGLMGPILAVPRIWAYGRIVHDETSYKSQTSFPFTLYRGTETQLPDPTFEAIHGAGNVPAYRGRAYIVLTDLDVGEFGNTLPNFEFEVVCEGPVDSNIHLVEHSDEAAGTAGLPVTWQWATAAQGGPFGIGIPWITQWDTSPGGKIVVKNMTTPGGHDYNADDLSYSGPTGNAGPNPFDEAVEGPSPSSQWLYWSIGGYFIGDIERNLFVYPAFSVHGGVATQNAALVADSIWSEDGANTVTGLEVAFTGGIPAGGFVVGTSLSQDKRTLLVFTGPTNGAAADTWYKLVDGEVVDTGTISPTIGGLGFASKTANGLNVNMLENNGQYMWHNSPTSGEQFSVYWINPDTNNFEFRSVNGTLQVDDGKVFSTVSIYVMREGFCGLVSTDQLAVVSRFPVYSPVGPSLEDTLIALSERAGLTSSQIEASSCADDFVEGFKIASQGTVRSAIAQLQAAYFVDVVESGPLVKFVKRGQESIVTIPEDDLACHSYGEEPPDALTTTRIQEVDLPRTVTTTFLDVDSDYQQGSQPYTREVTNSELEVAIGLPIVMNNTKARQISERTSLMSWIEREKFKISVSRKYAYLEPTDVIVAKNRHIKLTRRDESPEGVIRFDGVASAARVWIPAGTPAPGIGFTPQLPPIDQKSDLVLFDAPLLDDNDAASGHYTAVAGRDSPRWRGAGVFKSTDLGVNYTRVGTHTRASVIGQTETTLGDFSGGNIFDELNTVRVRLTDGSADLESKTEVQVLSGAQEALIGSEVIQFKNKTLVSEHVFDLSGLLRGRHGTEWAMGTHTPVEQFVLLSTVYDYPANVSEIGQRRDFKAVTLGATLAAADTTLFSYQGVRLKPLSPADLGGGTDASGNVTINWTRRTRFSTTWTSQPLGETSEAYVLQIWNAAFTQVARIVTGLTNPTFEYTAAMQVTDFGATQQTIFVSVGQVGQVFGYQSQAEIPGIGIDNDAPLNPVTPYETITPTYPPSNGTPDENHMANLATFMAGDIDDRRLGYRYTQLGPVTSFYQRKQFEIIDRFFHGSSYEWSLWVQDSEYNKPTLTPSEFNTLMALAAAA